jgi:hypothetical protein
MSAPLRRHLSQSTVEIACGFRDFLRKSSRVKIYSWGFKAFQPGSNKLMLRMEHEL